jgi:phosphoenolpyruvate carboxykinase (ATP)
MAHNGLYNTNFPVFGADVHYNLSEAELYEHAIRDGEARITADGSLLALTGQHTGRSAKDKYIVCDVNTQNRIWWDNNKPMTPDVFECLYADFMEHARDKKLFVQDLIAGADAAYALPTRIITEYAWHSLFIKNMLIHPQREELEHFVAECTIINLPTFKADPHRHQCRSETVIAIDLTRMLVLIGGTSYAGEIKKAAFTLLNALLPSKNVMPMHCSANYGTDKETAIFFGLSGTGKTTLSADPSRILIGDDEHGWSEDGVFNFEGGCYAKTIRLSQSSEPEIYAASTRFGTVLENVVVDRARVPDFDDGSLTENTRSAYPLHFIANASTDKRGGHPKNIIMLTADAFGVLPPVAKLTPLQAIYHFLSGYTAKLAGTEKGVVEPEAVFSACFGEPFMPLHPAEYGNLLLRLITEHNVSCWLVNTGWTGGAYRVGQRMPLHATRTILTSILDGSLKNASYRKDVNFNFDVPTYIQGVDEHILTPRNTWADGAAYDIAAQNLSHMFIKNFAKFNVDETIRDSILYK